jgi:hypothetical protein
MTGFANWGAASQGGRWLELFKEAVPRLTRVADIFFPSVIKDQPMTTMSYMWVGVSSYEDELYSSGCSIAVY